MGHVKYFPGFYKYWRGACLFLPTLHPHVGKAFKPHPALNNCFPLCADINPGGWRMFEEEENWDDEEVDEDIW